MKYCIITETQEIYKAVKVFAGHKIEITFIDIEEENKEEQLEYAALLRFKKEYILAKNLVINSLNCGEILKLIPQSDNNIKLDIPSLSLMA